MGRQDTFDLSWLSSSLIHQSPSLVVHGRVAVRVHVNSVTGGQKGSEWRGRSAHKGKKNPTSYPSDHPNFLYMTFICYPFNGYLLTGETDRKNHGEERNHPGRIHGTHAIKGLFVFLFQILGCRPETKEAPRHGRKVLGRLEAGQLLDSHHP